MFFFFFLVVNSLFYTALNPSLCFNSLGTNSRGTMRSGSYRIVWVVFAALVDCFSPCQKPVAQGALSALTSWPSLFTPEPLEQDYKTLNWKVPCIPRGQPFYRNSLSGKMNLQTI